MKQIWKTTLWVIVFAIAMGFMECAVVVYLREIYYPDGFRFPLQPIGKSIGITEILRETATLIMLISIGVLAAKRWLVRFAYFILAFAVWDIFYYVFLKVLLGWPESLFTWDILFLIPMTWVGPVLAPIINSLSMILLSMPIVYFCSKRKKVVIKAHEWILLILGSLVLIINYMEDYASFMLRKFTIMELFASENLSEIVRLSGEYVPRHFSWLWFWVGQLIILAAVIIFSIRNRREAAKDFS
ncbi:MAG: hypothetical protein K9G67_09925 [Bacteroidales bacterium]|nr:hypothetical protein [Bacteroidales bacterium]MCF8344078.1 hypothetical protein [Bacteroidales bacterium]MCF8376661.1 hypothetical protein [Bacteroidales bacterium]MCF8402045.1 hypothetical protein [Bacteroidales bacterium]